MSLPVRLITVPVRTFDVDTVYLQLCQSESGHERVLGTTRYHILVMQVYQAIRCEEMGFRPWRSFYEDLVSDDDMEPRDDDQEEAENVLDLVPSSAPLYVNLCHRPDGQDEYYGSTDDRALVLATFNAVFWAIQAPVAERIVKEQGYTDLDQMELLLRLTAFMDKAASKSN